MHSDVPAFAELIAHLFFEACDSASIVCAKFHNKRAVAARAMCGEVAGVEIRYFYFSENADTANLSKNFANGDKAAQAEQIQSIDAEWASFSISVFHVLKNFLC